MWLTSRAAPERAPAQYAGPALSVVIPTCGRTALLERCLAALVIHPLRPAPSGVGIFQARKMFFDALLYKKKHPRLYREKIRATPRWNYYATVAAPPVALAGGALWRALTARFCRMRLHGTAKSVSHVAEMVLGSALIPPHAVFWRLAGAIRFRVRFT